MILEIKYEIFDYSSEKKFEECIKNIESYLSLIFIETEKIIVLLKRYPTKNVDLTLPSWCYVCGINITTIFSSNQGITLYPRDSRLNQSDYSKNQSSDKYLIKNLETLAKLIAEVINFLNNPRNILWVEWWKALGIIRGEKIVGVELLQELMLLKDQVNSPKTHNLKSLLASRCRFCGYKEEDFQKTLSSIVKVHKSLCKLHIFLMQNLGRIERLIPQGKGATHDNLKIN